MPQEPPFSPTVTLLTLSRAWDAALTDALKPLGLTTRKYGLLGHIRGTPGISFSDLARRSRITVQSAHATVAAFAAAGLVQDATAHAGSASRLRVTAAGEQLLAEAGARVTELDARFSASHPGLVDALRDELRAMRSNLQLD
ncbi:MarR family winged helix-turn-helix transcriptional regulator [Cellulomonas dongxiuzhuiae]|uniref:MarR family winged helix-turn-helix transcriptional regulator n=1 Tax=Cellulomonas dongxiuzhuiae TaxID=2819979 RepID=A0ABX8GHY6_9CELL|nr:MarR family winged helix-turn-helix transcriptional regulator [Cellulomonas dongxiuzhuiae]MBO3088233.1 winged helix-turn-helix transcriptional regulator [Cellulomonas dongxiuzhuiae]MBO3094420.1 winged helix-turn-helix transcriptional regulator [Cellulomonas dongxiuzhuiae]QWC15448.1 MarR family winged helix-turn-helix transcriptional regulator [Cellulomonas dongxiuzhuiae]